MRYKTDPRYQRAIQQLARMGPDQMAVFNSAIVDAGFADEESRRELAGMVAASGNKYRDRSLELRAKALDTSTGLRKRALDFESGQRRIAEGLGAVNVLGSGYFGNRERMAMEAEAAANRKLRNRLMGATSGLGGVA